MRNLRKAASPPYESRNAGFRFSHGRDVLYDRYLLVIDKKNIEEVNHILSKKKITFAVLGKFSGDQINIKHKSKNLVKFRIDLAQKRYFNGLEDLLKHG